MSNITSTAITSTVDSTFPSGRVVLVTGAGSGMGQADALAFARNGATLALAGRREAPLQAVAQEITASGGHAAVLVTDLADAAAAAALPGKVVSRFGRLDAAFNNAGITAYAPIDQLTADDFDRVMATNVRAV